MAAVTLYTFVKSGTRYTVYHDDTVFTFIDYFTETVGLPDSGPPPDTIVNIVCAPGTTDRYTYKSKINPPYAYYSVEHNSTFCGYTPPACDIVEKSFVKTDETNTGANDGTANMFCASSYPPITYYLGHNAGAIANNTTGYFTGLPPGSDYYINAFDSNPSNCMIHQAFTIEAFNTTKTHFKYRLKFKSLDGQVQWELRLLDMQHAYDSTQYPKDVIGSQEPVVKKIGDPSEDKTTAIISTNLTITLHNAGDIFTVAEFVVPEKSWLCELYKDGVLDFRGWIIPDENQNPYSDFPFEFILKATDGLPSLKGNKWGNGSGGKGYGTYQIQQYGLASWISMVKQCLDQLGYDYGSAILLSSLQYNGTYDANLWLKISTWSDILYDSSGVPTDTYSALDSLLTGLKLSILQQNGAFIFVNWNDLYYLNNGLKAADFANAIYQFSHDFSSVMATGGSAPQPSIQLIGINYPNRPANPDQIITYDKSYNVEEDVSFNVLALLYENPSFEIGSVQGQLPLGFQRHGTTGNVAYCNYDPLDPTNPLIGAADGNWELREDWLYNTGSSADLAVLNNYIDLITPVNIDQPGLLVNLSFQWRPQQVPGLTTNTVPGFAIMFTTGGTEYIWDNGGSGVWTPFTEPPVGSELNTINHPSVFTNGDYLSWQSFSLTTKALPGSGIGTLNLRFYSPFFYYNGAYPAVGARLICDVDTVNLTTSSSNPANVNQTGETHITTAVTGIPMANLKQLNPLLFTYPPNKRIAGNVFYGTDYATGVVANTWNFKLKTSDPKDRLPATITRAIARNYCRPMYKWEGDVLSNNLAYFGIFVVKYIDNKVFVPFSIESKLRSGICHVIIIEIDDSDAQNVYIYTPIYQRNARSNG